MNIEISSRSRSFVSGLAAIAITATLMSTLVESMKPALMLGRDDFATQVSASALDIRSETTLARCV